MTSPTQRSRSRRVLDHSLLVLGAGALATGLGVLTLAPGISAASSHREAPLIAGDPRADNTDVYAFTSPDRSDTVTLAANWIPFEEPNGGPNFYQFADDARYNIKIDNTGDGNADVTYTWRFRTLTRDAGGQFLYNTGPVTSLNDPDLNIRQVYDLTVTTSAAPRPCCAGPPWRRRTWARRPCRTTPPCARRRSATPRGPQGLRRAGGGPVLRRSARLRPALRRGPKRTRAGHPRRVQRQLGRPPDPQEGPGTAGQRHP